MSEKINKQVEKFEHKLQMPLAGISDPFLKYQVKPDTELDV